MTTENTTIKINPTKTSTLEFDVMISGLDTVPIVRFVIQNMDVDVDWVINCHKLDDTKWQASFPILKNVTQSTCNFCVEVIVDEYFFKPAEGVIEFINVTDVTFKPKSDAKPSVTTSFIVKQSKEPIENVENNKNVEDDKQNSNKTEIKVSGLSEPSEKDKENNIDKNAQSVTDILSTLGIYTNKSKKPVRVPASIKSKLN